MRSVLLCLILASSARALAQTPAPDAFADSIRRLIESAVDAGDVAAADRAVTVVERALTAFPTSSILQHYHAYALYRAASMAIGQSGEAAARPYLGKAREILETLVRGETVPESHALLSSVYGMQIAVARVPMIDGMRLGPKSSAAMEKALAAGPNNPRVWVMKGIGAFNTPAMFGGGLDEAEQNLTRALSLFANDRPAPPLPAWGRADAHIWLGQVYARQGKIEAARAQYDSAQALQPANGWITHVLIPALNRK
jgi:tetratricopeptide (TPR) repeat protein